MVRAVASRVIPRYRVSKRMAKEAAEEASRMAEVALSAEVPPTVRRVPTRASDYTNVSLDGSRLANASIRPMGNSRRVFLLDPHLEAEDLEGLAHRIRALSKSDGINSVLIATDDQADFDSHGSEHGGGGNGSSSNNNCLPRYLTQRREIQFSGLSLDTDPEADHTWYVAGGYDPATIDPEDDERTDYLLESLRKLAAAVQGAGTETRIPIVSLPHGAVTDGGYALCMGSYVLATDESSMRILNPSRGLSLDPIGFSYVLPRLGRDFGQEAQRYRGCGMILALSGYEATASDLIETGLATHLVGDSGVLPILEEELATLPPWNQQGLVRKPRRMYGQETASHPQPQGGHAHHRQQQNYLQQQLQSQRGGHQSTDANGRFRNRSIAHLMAQVADVSADKTNDFPFDYSGSIYEDGIDDASLDTEHVPWESGFYDSPLVEMAADLDDVFRQERSLEGLMERLREVAATGTGGEEEEFSTPALAGELVERMERQSPLSLRVVYQLMKMGSSPRATMENCMAREGKAQRKLVKEPDFRNWLAHVQKHGGEAGAPPFEGWTHSSVAEVTAEEVDRLIS